MSENPIFSYTHRDYESSRKEGLSQIPIISKGQWTDLNATDPGVIILDYVHALVDMINYYQDHQALETFITTAKERSNIFRLAKQLSYKVRSAKGALCDVKFTSATTYDHTIRIPKYTELSTESGISYLTLTDAYLPKDELSVTVSCVQGVLANRQYTGTGISRFSNVVGASNQVVLLSEDNIDIDTIIVTDNIGRVWTSVDYIAFSGSSEKVYQVELNPDNTVSIKFGDGDRGYVPTESDILDITYLTSSAEEGRVEAGSIIYLKSEILDEDRYIDFTVYNNKASSSGSEVQSSYEIRELAPGAIKAQDRAVTLSDFENLAKLVSGVSTAKAYDINTNPDIDYNVVRVLIIPEDSSLENQEVLKTSVYDYLSARMIPATSLQISTPSYTSINISLTVKKLDSAISESLEYSIRETVINYFKEKSREIGEDFYPADLSAVISRVDGVRYVVSIEPSTIVQISDLSVASLGDLTVTIQ